MIIHYRTISTKYFGSSNVRGSRIIATASDDGAGTQKVVMSYDHALGTDENHAKAARLLAEKLDWVGTWLMGSADRGAVFVLANSEGFTVDERARS